MPAALAKIALIGDYSPQIPAHQAIPLALERARDVARKNVEWEWVSTCDALPRKLGEFDAIWVAPGSPYQDMDHVLEAIRWARKTQRLFLGTCGGFQHALIEFARNVLGAEHADHAETNPNGESLVVTRLACSLVEKTNRVRFSPGSHLRRIYGVESASEGYHCNYGLNPNFKLGLERAGLRFTAHDDSGEVRALELPTSEHPFFIGTLFQPERAALAGGTPPLAVALVEAVAQAEISM